MTHLPSLPPDSVLVSVYREDERNSDLWAYGACRFCLTELGEIMCGCDAEPDHPMFVCISTQGAVARGLTPITTL